MIQRDAILSAAIALTTGDRNDAYGDPAINLQCAAELKAVYDKYALWDAGLAHREAIHMALTKIARIATGGHNFRPDNYIDASCYPAIAGQVHPTNQRSTDE